MTTSKRFLVGFAAIASLFATSYGWLTFITTREAFYLFPAFCFLCTLFGAIYVYIANKKTYNLMMSSPKAAYEYAMEQNKHLANSATVIRLPEAAEDLVATDGYYSYLYTKDVLNHFKHPFTTRFKKGEAAIAKNARLSFSYASVIQTRFYEGESAIITEGNSIIPYIRGVIKGTWHEAEKAISKYDNLSKQYADTLKELGYDAKYAMSVLKHNPAIENIYKHLLFTDPKVCIDYMQRCIAGKSRWIEAEEHLAKDGYASAAYAKHVGARFEAGEKAIAKSNYAKSYAEFLRDTLKLTNLPSLLPEIHAFFTAQKNHDSVETALMEAAEKLHKIVESKYPKINLTPATLEALKVEFRTLPHLKDIPDAVRNLSTPYAHTLPQPVRHLEKAKVVCDQSHSMDQECRTITTPAGHQFTLLPTRFHEEAKAAYAHAIQVVKGRYEKGEDVIARCAETSCDYAINVLNGRFEKGENVIGMSEITAKRYGDFLYGCTKGNAGWSSRLITPMEAVDLLKKLPADNKPLYDIPLHNIFAHVIKRSARASWEYVFYFKDRLWGTRLALFEPILSEEADTSYNYAKYIRKGAFPAGEDAIAKNGNISANYAINILKSRFEKGEEAIANNGPTNANNPVAMDYAEFLYKEKLVTPLQAHGILVEYMNTWTNLSKETKQKEFVNVKSVIFHDIIKHDLSLTRDYLRWVKNIGHPFIYEVLEDAIAKSGNISFQYARDIRCGRFEKGETAIASDATLAFSYATQVLGGRFEKGEPNIAKHNLGIDYAQYLRNMFVTPQQAYDICQKVPDTLSPTHTIFKHIIKLYAPTALQYAKLILKAPFPEGEKCLRENADLWKEYTELFNVPVEPGRSLDYERLLEEACVTLGRTYIDSVFAWVNGTDEMHPSYDERFMREIEEETHVDETIADDFRRMIAGLGGKLANQGKKFQWNSNAKLQKAIERVAKRRISAVIADPNEVKPINGLDVDTCLQVAKTIRKGRYHEGEHIIAKDANATKEYGLFLRKSVTPDSAASILYALHGSRSSKFNYEPDPRIAIFEHVICNNTETAIKYAKEIKQIYGISRFPVLEQYLANHAWGAYTYACNVLCGRFKAGEEAIAQTASGAREYADMLSNLTCYALDKGENVYDLCRSNPKLRPIFERLMFDPMKCWQYMWSCYHGINISATSIGRKAPFPLCEDTIAKSAEYSYRYAKDFLDNTRFVKGEPAIAKDPVWSMQYSLLIGERFKAGEASIATVNNFNKTPYQMKEFVTLIKTYAEKFFPKLYNLHYKLITQKKSSTEIKAAVDYLRVNEPLSDTPEEAKNRNTIARMAAEYAIAYPVPFDLEKWANEIVENSMPLGYRGIPERSRSPIRLSEKVEWIDLKLDDDPSNVEAKWRGVIDPDVEKKMILLSDVPEAASAHQTSSTGPR